MSTVDFETYRRIKEVGKIAERISKLTLRQAQEFVRAFNRGNALTGAVRATIVLYKYEEYIEYLRDKLRKASS